MHFPAPFKIERYFAQYEFTAPYLFSSSDCESLSLRELLSDADTESLRLWENLRLGYTESLGHPLLRAEIARLYPSLSAENALVVSPIEAIFLAMHALLKPGDHVVSIFPAYQALYEVPRSIGCEVSLWQLTARDKKWHADVDQLASLITSRTRSIIINFPHNPTGCLPSREIFDAIVNLAREHDLFLFSDEMYRWLELDETQRLPSACEVYEKAIVLSGLSKTFALPGLRIGWLVAHDRDFLTRCQSLKDYTSICHSAPSEVLAIIALRAYKKLAARSLEIVRGNINRAEKFFDENSKLFRWLPPQAGSIAFPEWLGSRTIEEFCDLAVKEAGVMIVPGEIFDMPGRHFRVGLGRKNFPEALKRLADFLNKHYE
jgi:aspartate/methionine/tyrosine aminotransferase